MIFSRQVRIPALRQVLAGVGLAVSAASASSLVPVGTAAAYTVPFTDSSVSGLISFCDPSGHAITSGSTLDHPTFWVGVSSSAAPTTYTHAALFAYQPLQYVDPGNWSGYELTPSAAFSNPAHPMTQGTVADNSLYQYLQAYPSHWDGLVQIRMFFGGGNGGPVTQPYPAAVVQVKGTSWRVVQGGSAPCNSGSVQSDLARGTKPASFNRPKPTGTSPASTRRGQPTSSINGAAGFNPSSQPGGPQAEASGHTGRASRASDSWVVAVGVALGAIVVGGASMVFRRRRRSAVGQAASQ